MELDRLPGHASFAAWWNRHGLSLIEDYVEGKCSYVRALPPEMALDFDGVRTAEILYRRLGAATFQQALNPNFSVPSPATEETSGNWLRRSNTVGINVRTIGSFYQVVKYALTLPAHVDCIHLLPIWEPGVVASLYGMASWQVNPEFFSPEWRLQFYQLDTVEKQLKVTINLLHAMGKKVGMDVIPHTDRYSEIVLANPGYFEWLRRDDVRIVDHREQLHEEVEEAVWVWLRMAGVAMDPGTDVPVHWRKWLGMNQEANTSVPVHPSEKGGLVPPPNASVPVHARFFSHLPESTRLQLLFGPAADHTSRRDRRIRLVDHLYRLGYEPVPATMAPPYRGLEVDPDPSALTVDEAGRKWRDYRITQPQEMSRVFGPLTRYKLYERVDDNANWGIDFEQPRKAVWEYVATKYGAIQSAYGFDFMRGDMSHVQMRPGGTPAEPDAYYDLLGYVKKHIQKSTPYFAYFAESFLTEPGYMAYGDEIDHLEASHAEVTLGNLQSMVPGEPEFLSNFRRYLDIAATRSVTPAFTVITGDKDDPRFDKFYRWANEARLFTALFLPTLPGYYALGFEQRDIHPYPFPNEYYTKLYVFHLDQGPKATSGPYRWGKNLGQFFRLDRIHAYAEALTPVLETATVQWLLPPDTTGGVSHVCWLLQSKESDYYCLVNFGSQSVQNVRIPLSDSNRWQLLFSTHHQRPEREIKQRDNTLILSHLEAEEGIIIMNR